MSKFFRKKRFHLSSPANLVPSFTSTSNYSDNNSSKTTTNSPSSSSALSSPCGNGGFFSPQSKKRLTRQRKLRHVTVEEFCLPEDGHLSKSLPVSPNSESRSLPDRLLQHWSLSAVPQPLPLPNDELRFPAAETCNRDQRGRYVMNTKNDDNSKKSTYHRRRGYPEGEKVGGSIRLDVPARSCPNTTFTSPTLSPKRFSTVDSFDSAFKFPREFHSETSTRPSQLHSKNKSPQETSMARPLPLPVPPIVSNSRPVNVSSRQSLDKSDSHSIKGQWQKGKLIGRGAYGSVYEAVNRETGSLCAMKEVDVIPDDTKSCECIRQLEQEIKVLRNLDHPNIVQYLGCELVEDRFCIYLEYIHPGSMNKYVREHCGAITESVVRNFTRHVLSGLAYLHSKKTVHRDIKGANLLVDASGVVKLADFGLAKHLIPHGNDLSLKGSPHWMAPEVLQAVMRKDANPEHTFTMDIWSLGCTVIEMVTGKPPWSEFNAVQAMFNVLNRSPPIPETLSSEGKDFLVQCLQRNPENRSSAAMLLEHPFVCNSFPHSFSFCNQEFSSLRLKEISRDSPARHKDTMQQSPSMSVKHGRLQFRCGTPKHPPAETIKDNSAASRQSPRSTLEVVANVSWPELNHSPVITMERGRTYSLPTTPSRETYHF